MPKTGLELLDDLIGELTAVVGQVENNAKSLEGNNAILKKHTGAKPPPAPLPAVKAEVTINSLDLRVGVIVEVKKHETADKLYCEQIDIGEAVPRAIASGLVPHYTLEEMMGRRLIVVANLKPRNLVGFKSFGMVLCAAKVDPVTGLEKVEFVDPPLDAKIGDRVVALVGGAAPSEALSSAQVEKQKAFEVVAHDLRVNGQGVAEWKGVQLTVSGAVCTAPTLREAIIR
jgi:aminoacyl tRNA synthase complex-interacting multifunctional protein 1